MKIKKLITLLLSLTVFLGCFAACGDPGNSGGGQHDPNKTVDILISKGGYGDKYLRDVVDAFNTYYASEGYYVNLLAPREGFGTASSHLKACHSSLMRVLQRTYRIRVFPLLL